DLDGHHGHDLDPDRRCCHHDLRHHENRNCLPKEAASILSVQCAMRIEQSKKGFVLDASLRFAFHAKYCQENKEISFSYQLWSYDRFFVMWIIFYTSNAVSDR